MIIHSPHIKIQCCNSQSTIFFCISLFLPFPHNRYSIVFARMSLEGNTISQIIPLSQPAPKNPIYPIKLIQYNDDPSQDPPNTHPSRSPTIIERPSLILSCLICLSIKTIFYFYWWSPLTWFCTPPLYVSSFREEWYWFFCLLCIIPSHLCYNKIFFHIH